LLFPREQVGCHLGNSAFPADPSFSLPSRCNAAPDQQQETTMKSTNEKLIELADSELATVAGGELSDAVRFIIAAIASPAPYNPKEPGYSGYGHMIGTCPK
jgi:hypothetical protein